MLCPKMMVVTSSVQCIPAIKCLQSVFWHYCWYWTGSFCSNGTTFLPFMLNERWLKRQVCSQTSQGIHGLAEKTCITGRKKTPSNFRNIMLVFKLKDLLLCAQFKIKKRHLIRDLKKIKGKHLNVYKARVSCITWHENIVSSILEVHPGCTWLLLIHICPVSSGFSHSWWYLMPSTDTQIF